MQNWINVNTPPIAKESTDVYTHCICGGKGFVVTDAVFYHYKQEYYHNSDTSHSSPIPATHWQPPLSPPIQKKQPKHPEDCGSLEYLLYKMLRRI